LEKLNTDKSKLQGELDALNKELGEINGRVDELQRQ
jgi:peptidoglycan hydrolase CwlO-like protein